jgi:hypothetical protein
MIQRTRLLVGAILAGTATAALIPLSPALSEESPPNPLVNVEIADTGTVEARGAVATVTLHYTCPETPAPFAAFVNVQLTQRSGNGIASGGAGEQAVCDGTQNELTVTIPASGKPFKRGVAFAIANLNVCNPFEPCVAVRDSEEIQLTRP